MVDFSIGDVIRKLRIARELTILDLARRARISKVTLSGIEHNSSNARPSRVARVLAALGLTESEVGAEIDAFCERRIGPSKLTDDEREVIRLWNLVQDRRTRQTVLWLLRREVELSEERYQLQPRSQGRARKQGLQPQPWSADGLHHQDLGTAFGPPTTPPTTTPPATESDSDHEDEHQTPSRPVGTPTGRLDEKQPR